MTHSKTTTKRVSLLSISKPNFPPTPPSNNNSINKAPLASSFASPTPCYILKNSLRGKTRWKEKNPSRHWPNNWMKVIALTYWLKKMTKVQCSLKARMNKSTRLKICSTLSESPTKKWLTNSFKTITKCQSLNRTNYNAEK